MVSSVGVVSFLTRIRRGCVAAAIGCDDDGSTSLSTLLSMPPTPSFVAKTLANVGFSSLIVTSTVNNKNRNEMQC